MEYTPQSANSMPETDELDASLLAEEESDEEQEEHIHMPNPSFWPLLAGIFIAVAIVGFLFIGSTFWIALIGIIGALVCIIGWGAEDPTAPLEEKYVTVYREIQPDLWKYKIGQDVVDAQGKWLGTVQARFSRYILVERGGFLPRAYYVPHSAIKEEIRNDTLFLTLSEEDLERMELDRVPDDLYEEPPEEAQIPVVRGAPQFARRPLSPAETGHYNYGRRWPGINTDATGSYHREEVLPKPQNYVVDDIYSTDEPIPPRVISPD